jgi:hypothetical protein
VSGARKHPPDLRGDILIQQEFQVSDSAICRATA